jgi:thiamine transport system permease protein
VFNRKRFTLSLTLGILTAAVLIGIIALFLILLLIEGGSDLTAPNKKIWRILGFTAFQAGLSTLLSLAIGITLAWALSHKSLFFGRSVLIALLSVAMVLPTLVAVLGLVTVWGRRGWFNEVLSTLDLTSGTWIYGLGGILLAHSYLNAPFMARSLLQRLEGIPAEQRKLSQSLGLTPWQRFRFVEWAAIKGSLPALCSTVFLLCFTSFAIVLTLGGSSKYNTLEVAIYEAIKLDFDLPHAVILALMQLAVCALLVSVASTFRLSSNAIDQRRFNLVWKEPRLTAFAQGLIIVLFAAFFLAPLVAILTDGINADLLSLFSSSLFLKTSFNSLALATASAFLTISLAMLLVKARVNTLAPLRLKQSKSSLALRQVLSFSGSVYLAVPSLVMAFGFFLLARSLFSSIYLVAPFALVIANALLALPFALAVLGPAIEKVTVKDDRLAFSLGLSGWSRWRLLEWPLIKPELTFVAALSFCFSLGDFGIIALFGTQDFATLPWLLYQKMGSYRTDEAAAIALVLLTITLLVFLAVPQMRKGNPHA